MTDSPKDLRKFMESNQPATVRRGLSMVKDREIPDELLGLVAGLYMWHDDTTIRVAAKSAFVRWAPEDVKEVVKKTWKTNYRKLKTEKALRSGVKKLFKSFKGTPLDTIDLWKPALARTSGDTVSIVQIMENFGVVAKARPQSKKLEIPTTISVYYWDDFIGRGATEESPRRWGLTDWIAENHELFDLNLQVNENDRKVDETNRAMWEESTHTFLGRWFPNHASRACFRKSNRDKNGNDTWFMFPHPEDAEVLNLTGRNGDLPVALINIKQDRKDATIERMYIHRFTTKSIADLDENDLVLTSNIDLERAHDYAVYDRNVIVPELPTTLRKMKSTVQNVEKRMKDWVKYLEWMYKNQRSNEWGAKITDIRLPTGDDPYYILTIQAPEKIWKKIGDRREGGASLRAIAPEHSQNTNLWKRTDESQDDMKSRYRNETAAGDLRRVRGKPKEIKGRKGRLEGCIVVDPPNPENPLSGLSEQFIGYFLINDVSSDLFQINRQRKGLERLQELEASSYNRVHEWLFDISQAHAGLKALPELAHEPLHRLNAEQELAVRGALHAPDVFLIQGPPGTGKTTVIAELINQATEGGMRVLLASQSNLAVDNALGLLAQTPNVRPIRRFSISAEIDPEAEKFLEENVIREFFVPSIRKHCGAVHKKSEALRRSRDAVIQCNEQLHPIKEEWRKQTKKLASLDRKRDDAMDSESDVNDTKERILQDMDSLQAARIIIEDEKPEMLDANMAAVLGIEHSRITDLLMLVELKSERISLDALSKHLNNLRAQKLKTELESEVKDRREAVGDWTLWTRKLNRLLPETGWDELLTLSRELKSPENLSDILAEQNSRIRARIEEVQLEAKKLESRASATRQELSRLLKKSRQAIVKELEGVEADVQKTLETRRKIEEQRELPRRRLADATQTWLELLESLPGGIVDENDLAVEGTDPDSILKVAKGWMDEHQELIKKDDNWRAIRKDWLADLEKPEDSTLRDLEAMYLRLVNIEGVTTSKAGSFQWYKKHLQNPFDLVIIDEISKATPPELLLPLLLGRRAVLVGDHRQLPPTFKKPNKREEASAEEMAKLDKKFNEYERMVTSALFAEYFQDAQDSIKCTLRTQYRMHEVIMRCTNEFYEGQLKCGLSHVEEEKRKQHGFNIAKRDSGGTYLREGSELITPQMHAVWIDSSFSREGTYCSEMDGVKIPTSRRNEREVRIARHLINEFNEQIGLKKDLIAQDEWNEDSMLRHLDQANRLPVGFITFYADQKYAFQEIANENDSWARMLNRWPHLTVKADTVDRFQGGERPVIIVSMVVSPKLGYWTRSTKGFVWQSLNDTQRLEFEDKVSKIWYDPPELSRRRGFKTGGIPKTRTSFVRSPERINVAFSRAQNLLIILGNRYTLDKVDNVHIRRDDGKRVDRKAIYKQIHRIIGKGGMIDGRDLL